MLSGCEFQRPLDRKKKIKYIFKVNFVFFLLFSFIFLLIYIYHSIICEKSAFSTRKKKLLYFVVLSFVYLWIESQEEMREEKSESEENVSNLYEWQRLKFGTQSEVMWTHFNVREIKKRIRILRTSLNLKIDDWSEQKLHFII